jgi:hypothetical protein
VSDTDDAALAEALAARLAEAIGPDATMDFIKQTYSDIFRVEREEHYSVSEPLNLREAALELLQRRCGK